MSFAEQARLDTTRPTDLVRRSMLFIRIVVGVGMPVLATPTRTSLLCMPYISLLPHYLIRILTLNVRRSPRLWLMAPVSRSSQTSLKYLTLLRPTAMMPLQKGLMQK
jgi:hypothetical protein